MRCIFKFSKWRKHFSMKTAIINSSYISNRLQSQCLVMLCFILFTGQRLNCVMAIRIITRLVRQLWWEELIYKHTAGVYVYYNTGTVDLDYPYLHYSNCQLSKRYFKFWNPQSSARNKDQKLVGRFFENGYFLGYRLLSPLKMYRKFGWPKWILVSQMLKLVGKWPMADCYI